MPKAIWHGTVIAESRDAVRVERKTYFPRDDVRVDLLEVSDRTSVCPWKGTARYYSVVVDGDRNRDAAWEYPKPREGAVELRDRIAFWRGVRIVRDVDEPRPGLVGYVLRLVSR